MSNKQSFIITNEEDKIKMYFIHIYMLHGEGTIVWKENEFTENTINALNAKMNRNYKASSMGGFINNFNSVYRLTDSEYDNSITLTNKGFKTFYKNHYEILEFGKENKLDQFLSSGMKGYIPNKFLN